ncbi:MAG: NHL repeat-containing protein [Betaproteobacteria bacterium]|nr:MAG: NHL repeat-containing protein [Betaproteobacteria bacterium]
MKLKTLLAALLFISSHVLAADFTVVYQSTSNTPLSNPHDLKLSPDGKYLFVSDVGNNRVVLLDPETLAFVDAWGDDHQSGTHDVDFDKQGRVYVADTHNNRVTIYRMEGTKGVLVGELEGRIRGPEGVLIHSNGRVYVAGAWSGNAVAYKGGRVVSELGGLSAPHDLEETADGSIWLSDSNNHRVLLVSPDLKILRVLDRKTYDFNGVRYLDLLEDGTLVAADKNNHQIKFIAPDGKLLLVMGSGRREEGPDRFATPEGVEIRGNTIWFSDSGNNRVVKYVIRRQ